MLYGRVMDMNRMNENTEREDSENEMKLMEFFISQARLGRKAWASPKQKAARRLLMSIAEAGDTLEELDINLMQGGVNLMVLMRGGFENPDDKEAMYNLIEDALIRE